MSQMFNDLVSARPIPGPGCCAGGSGRLAAGRRCRRGRHERPLHGVGKNRLGCVVRTGGEHATEKHTDADVDGSPTGETELACSEVVGRSCRRLHIRGPVRRRRSSLRTARSTTTA